MDWSPSVTGILITADTILLICYIGSVAKNQIINVMEQSKNGMGHTAAQINLVLKNIVLLELQIRELQLKIDKFEKTAIKSAHNSEDTKPDNGDE